MDCPGSNMRECNFANIRMPLELGSKDDFQNSPTVSGNGRVNPDHADKVAEWIKYVGCAESGIYFQNFLYRGNWWWRISGMIYLEEDDFRRGAKVLKALCKRVRDGKYLDNPSIGLDMNSVGAPNLNEQSSTDGSPINTPMDSPTLPAVDINIL
jgi:hercynylcysteine S-oxide lyase